MKSIFQCVSGNPKPKGVTPSFPPDKHYSLKFWFPLFPCSYRVTTWRWLQHWFTPHYYIDFFKTKWQRMTKGFANADTWDLNDYLAEVIYHALLRFKEVGHGYPGGMTEEEWNVVLDKMIAGFAAKIQLLDDFTYADHCWVKKETYSEEDSPLTRSVGEFNQELYDAWRAPLDAQWKEGSALFLEHFDSLWD